MKSTTHENAVLVLKSTGQDVVLHVIRPHPEPEEETMPVVTTAAMVTEADSSPPSSVTGCYYLFFFRMVRIISTTKII